MSEYPDELWRSVADLSSMLLSEETQETTLRRVSDLAVRSVAGCDAVGVTLLDPAGRPTTRAASGGMVYEVDHHQYDIGEGPCLAAMAERCVVEVTDMVGEDRWPRFCRHAAERGVHASMSFPILVRAESIGALNLYAYQSHAFKPHDAETGLMFAVQAGITLANAQTYAASVTLSRQLGEALDSRAVIDQAMGILIGQNGYDQERAMEDLRAASQNSNRKLRHVAEEIVKGAIKRHETDRFMDGAAPTGRPGNPPGR